MNLFDKINSIKKEHAEARAKGEPPPSTGETVPDELVDQPKQCNCGAALEGECSECNADRDVDPAADILGRLQTVGNKRDINPPPPKVKPTTGPLPPAPPEAPPVRTHLDPTPEPTPESPPKAEKPKEQCPHCKKSFKILSRHKCKVPKFAQDAATCAGLSAEELEETPETPSPAEEVPEAPAEPKAPEEAAQVAEEVTDAAVAEATKNMRTNFLKDQVAKLAKKASADAETIARLEAELAEERKGADEEIPYSVAKAYFILLLDALPLRDLEAPVVYFADFVGPIAAQVAVEHCVPHWSSVDYGKGPGLLAVAVDKALDELKPRGFIVADSKTAEVSACLSVLTYHAKNVIRGI